MLATEQRLLDGVARRLGGQAGTVQHEVVDAVTRVGRALVGVGRGPWSFRRRVA